MKFHSLELLSLRLPVSGLLSVILVAMSTLAASAQGDAYADKVKTIDSTIETLYAVISGSSAPMNPIIQPSTGSRSPGASTASSYFMTATDGGWSVFSGNRKPMNIRFRPNTWINRSRGISVSPIPA